VALTFRRATPDDVAALHALVEGAYRGDSSRTGWTTEADLLDGQRTDREELDGLIRGETTRFLLGCDGDAPVACVLLSDEGEVVYLGMFVVRPDLQSRGLGKLVLAEAERVARDEMKRRAIRMTVIAQRPELIDWYTRRGYHPTGAREDFPYGDPRSGVPRRDDLYFVVLLKELGG
jgi:GNAT superfamily N-acetyltransferase